MVPRADRRRHLLRALKPHALQGLERLRVVFDAGKDQAAEVRRQRLGLREQLPVVAVDKAQGARHGQVEAAEIGEARQDRHRHARVVGFRQLVCLLIVDHLHAMFPVAQTDIGLLELLGDRRRQVAGTAQGVQRVERPS